MLLESRRLRQQKIIRKFQAICLNMSRRLQLPEALHSARSVFLSLAGFWRTRERLCSSRVRYLLNIRRRLLGYGFEPRPACDSGLAYVHRIINKWMLALE